MKKILLLLFLCLPFASMAKNKKDNSNPKYLSGAVVMTDGKVTFSKEIKAAGLTKKEIYGQMLDWAQKRFTPNDKLNSRVAYTNEEDGDIAATGEEYLVFSSSALSLDRTRIYYQFLIHASDNLCQLTMTRIRYWYDEARDGGEKYTAEEWITDDMALNKKKTKLVPPCGKFRRETIDLKDALFEAATAALGQQMLASNTSASQAVPATPSQPASQPNLSGELKETTVAQLPSSLNALVTSGRITLKAGENEELEMKTESWGGFGKMFNKDVTYLLIDQSQATASELMERSNTYKISFCPANGNKAIMTIECKKAMAQKMSAEDLKSLNQSIDGSKQYTMYIGEVMHIQIRQ